MKTYTKKQVLELLKQQREICYRSAKIVEHEYVNPFSESDGHITKVIDENSIINAKIPRL